MTQDENRRLSWNIYKWIRKNDPELSLEINRELSSIAEKIIVDYQIMISKECEDSYDEIKKAINKVIDAEIKYNPNDFVLNKEISKEYLDFNKKWFIPY